MSRRRVGASRALAVLVLVLLAGCESTPRQQYAQQEIALTSFSDALLTLEAAGTIDEPTFATLARGAIAAGGYLDAAGEQLAAIEAGSTNTTEFGYWLSRARSALLSLQAVEQERNTIPREGVYP